MNKIAKKFVEVMKDCSHVSKNGSNDFHKYKYATAADVLEKVNASLTNHGLASVVVPNLLSMQTVTTAKGNSEQLATVEVVITRHHSHRLRIRRIPYPQGAWLRARPFR